MSGDEQARAFRMLAEAINALAVSQTRLAHVLEVHCEAMPIAEEARLLGTSSKRVARMRRKRKNERLMMGGAA